MDSRAKGEQALAKLFYRSGWTQEELGKKEGKGQPWVNYRLRFGRFLEFITTGDISQKPERRLQLARWRQPAGRSGLHSKRDREARPVAVNTS